MPDKPTTTNTAFFDEVIAIIENSCEKAFRAVNRELIDMYWHVGERISRRVSEHGWGKSVANDFSLYIQHRYPDLRGFSASNIWRMKHFYETYRDNEKLAALLREISWTNHPHPQPAPQ